MEFTIQKNYQRLLNFLIHFFFNDFTKDYHDVHKIKKLWISAQQKINLKNNFTYLKTHHLNCNMGIYPFTNTQNTVGSIYIIRDPRNVVTSFANHFVKDIKEARDVMFNVLMTGTKPPGIFELVGSWSQNYESWIKFNKNWVIYDYAGLFIELKNSALFLVSFNLELINSIASIVPIGAIILLRTFIF